MSGQPSLIFVGHQSETSEQVVSPVEDVDITRPVELEGSHCDEGTAAYLSVDAVQDGASDEGFAADEADFACSSSAAVVDSAPHPDVVAGFLKSEPDPDVHWNLHAPEFEFRASAHDNEADPRPLEIPAEMPVPERKLSATELLIRSSNDAQLAVLLAAANDDPDEMEPHEEELDFEPISPRSLDDTQNTGANGKAFLFYCFYALSKPFCKSSVV